MSEEITTDSCISDTETGMELLKSKTLHHNHSACCWDFKKCGMSCSKSPPPTPQRNTLQQWYSEKKQSILSLYFCVYMFMCVRVRAHSACVKRQADMLTDSQKRIFCLLLSERLILRQCPHLSVSLPVVCLSQYLINLTCSVSEPFQQDWAERINRSFIPSSPRLNDRWVIESFPVFFSLLCFELLRPVYPKISKIDQLSSYD